MLQQTQVPRVIEKFEAWVVLFPNFSSLAAASEDDVLAAWEGLGYYRRARNLHRLAQHLIRDFQTDHAIDAALAATDHRQLCQLPGVGPYTAAALCAFAFQRPEAAIDTNVRRVVARLVGLAARQGPPPKPGVLDNHVEDWLRSSFDRLTPRTVHEALMDFGSAVCTTKTPSCAKCPLVRHCLAPTETADQLPRLSRLVAPPTTHAIGLLRQGTTLLVPKEWKAPIVPRADATRTKRLGDPRHLLKQWYLQHYGVKVAVRPAMGFISTAMGRLSAHRVALIQSDSAHFQPATPSCLLDFDPVSVSAFETLRLTTAPL